MDVGTIFHSHLVFNLTDGFDKGQGFNIAHGTTNFCDDNISSSFLCSQHHPPSDFIGNIGNNLNCSTVKATFPLLVQDGKIHASSGGIAALRQVYVGKALIVTQVQVGLGTVICDKNLSVLVGIHGAWINVEIGVEFLVNYT